MYWCSIDLDVDSSENFTHIAAAKDVNQTSDANTFEEQISVDRDAETSSSSSSNVPSLQFAGVDEDGKFLFCRSGCIIWLKFRILHICSMTFMYNEQG